MRRKRIVRDPFLKLKGLMVEKGYSQSSLSKDMNVTIATLNRKINGLAEFSWTDIEKLIRLLEIQETQIGEIFFTKSLLKRNESA